MHVTAARLLTAEAGDMNLSETPDLGLCFNMGGRCRGELRVHPRTRERLNRTL